MSEPQPIPATKEHPAPLDAFETAKPDEPIWTVQGGDPLGPPLLRLWSTAARIRAGAITPACLDEAALKGLVNAATSHLLTDERESQNLLVRATATEEISWSMDAYAKGQLRADVPTEADDTHIDEMARIDLHDARLYAAGRISNFFSELNDILIDLVPQWMAAGGVDEAEPLIPELRDVIDRLRAIGNVVEPRRNFKKDPPHGQ